MLVLTRGEPVEPDEGVRAHARVAPVPGAYGIAEGDDASVLRGISKPYQCNSSIAVGIAGVWLALVSGSDKTQSRAVDGHVNGHVGVGNGVGPTHAGKNLHGFVCALRGAGVRKADAGWVRDGL